jgi:hypothetical protein
VKRRGRGPGLDTGCRGPSRGPVFAFDPAFRGGVTVAVGDVTGDGVADIIAGAWAGGAGHVRVLDGLTGAEAASFFAFGPDTRNGVRVAAGDVDKDEVTDLVFAPAAGADPTVLVVGGQDLLARGPAAVADPLWRVAADPRADAGVRVAVRDLGGDGRTEVVTRTAGVTRVFDPLTRTEVASEYDPALIDTVFVG